MSNYMGVDIGSVTTKGLVTADGKIIASAIIPSGSNYRTAADRLRAELIKQSGLEAGDIACIAVTGRGADKIPFGNMNFADMRCCARGNNRLFPAPVRS
jgi:activator of 2-hydroxyglutaryl-CoA dehydratase